MERFERGNFQPDAQSNRDYLGGRPVMRFFAWFLLALPSQLVAANSLIDAIEQKMSHYQTEQLKDELPIQDVWVENQSHVWMLSQRNLWRWDLDAMSFQKFPLASIGENILLQLKTDGKSLYVAASGGIFHLAFDPYQVLFYPFPEKQSHLETITMTGDADNLFIVRENGIFRIQTKTQTLEPVILGLRFLPKDKVIYNPATKNFWLARHQSLQSIEIRGINTADQITSFTAKHPILDIVYDGKSLYAYTRHAVIQFDPRGEPIASIAVEGERRIARMATEHDSHAYMYSDKLFEIFNLSAKTSRQYFVELGKVRSAGSLSLRDDTLAFIADGIPRIFRLPQRL